MRGHHPISSAGAHGRARLITLLPIMLLKICSAPSAPQALPRPASTHALDLRAPRWRRTPLAHGLACCLVAMAPSWGAAQGMAPVAEPQTLNTPSPQSDDDVSGATMPAVTVNANRLDTEAPTLTTPAAVLEGDALMQTRSATLGDTLSGELGIQASHFGAGASRPIIRGMDGARVKVLANGAEIQDASTISPDHAVTTDPMLAERIEVLRGPSALVHSAGAMGGVVNVVDQKIPTAIPQNGHEGRLELRAGTGAREKAGAFSLTGGAGQFAVHVEGVSRDAGDYPVGRGWAGGNKVLGSQSRGATGSVGVSWIGNHGFLGASATRQTAQYGLPGHNHDAEGCHPHGLHLHCGGHDDHAHGDGDGAHDDHAHDHADAHVPRVDLRSNRYDLRGEWRRPVAGIDVVRIRGGLTRYRHDEVDDGAIATTFRNNAHDLRLEAQHSAMAGWTGLFGIETTRRRFSAVGEEAYVQPTDTQRHGVFLFEEKRFGDVGVTATLRHDWQSVTAQDQAVRTSHRGNSASVGANWRIAPEWRVSANFTTASRMPTAEELYARGLHMATNTYELGNAKLRPERSRNLDIGLAKTAGNTTMRVGVYHNRIGNYMYGRTVDAVQGVQLVQYTQATAQFSGLEAQISHKLAARWLGANWRATAWGDTVHARLSGGQRIARLAPARAGLKLAAQWGNWGTQAEWLLVKRQSKVAEFETPTPGHGVVNWGVSYQSASRGDGKPWQAYLQLNNLGNKLAYVHTSFIKASAPLQGRTVVLGVSKAF